jgi:hypothetical protein
VVRHQLQCVLAGVNGDSGRQLQQDDDGACISAVETVSSGVADVVFVRCWILNYVIFVFIFGLFCIIQLHTFSLTISKFIHHTAFISFGLFGIFGPLKKI